MFKLTTLPPLHTLLFVIIRTILVEIWRGPFHWGCNVTKVAR